MAYYWTGAVPEPRKVRQIGLFGARILGPEGFYPGTLLQIVLEDRAAGVSNGTPPHICVCAKALRKVEDGFCVAFMFGDARERRMLLRFLEILAKAVEGPKGPELVREVKQAGSAEEAEYPGNAAGGMERGTT